MDELHINIDKCLHQSWEYYFFLNFLKKNEVKPVQFFNNCVKQNNGRRLISFLNRMPPRGFNEIIMESFNWSKTPEGGTFWSLLYSKFVCEYNTKYREMESRHNIKR